MDHYFDSRDVEMRADFDFDDATTETGTHISIALIRSRSVPDEHPEEVFIVDELKKDGGFVGAMPDDYRRIGYCLGESYGYDSEVELCRIGDFIIKASSQRTDDRFFSGKYRLTLKLTLSAVYDPKGEQRSGWEPGRSIFLHQLTAEWLYDDERVTPTNTQILDLLTRMYEETKISAEQSWKSNC